MVNIKWLDVFETGIPFIDDDHKHLVRIIGDIEQAHTAGDIGGCRSAVGLFLDEAKAHFHREEKYLQVIGYCGLNGHARQHRSLIDMVVRLLEDLQPDPKTGKEPDLDEKLIEDALYVLLEDVIRADAEFKTIDL